MTEADAKAIIADMGVSRETLSTIETFCQLVIAENNIQNLISKTTEACIWDRHILDSAQLTNLACDRERCWLDVGTGAGFPGMVLAILLQSEHVLVEPRRRRADFLSRSAETLGLSHRVRVMQTVVERIERPAVGTITARAVASINDLISKTRHLTDPGTTWLLHKGRSALSEFENAKASWDARFEMIPSISDADAAIVCVTELRGRRE